MINMSEKNKKLEEHPPHEPHIVQTGKESIKICVPGEYVLSENEVLCNRNRKTEKLTVKNTGDRPIQVGSHTHFFEVNKKLDFPREKAFGYRLNIPAGTAIRFEPGDTKEIELCELGGKNVVFGFNSLTMGSLKSAVVKAAALEKAKKLKFKGA
jgi:urease subunit beta